MATTYTLINSNVLSSSAASITFSSIPATYTDLVLRVSMKYSSTSTSTIYGKLEFNGVNSGNLYSMTALNSMSNTTAYSERYSNENQFFEIFMNSSNALYTNVFASGEFYIPSYTASQNKPFSSVTVAEMNNTAGYDLSGTAAGLFRSTAAITSITIFPVNTNFTADSSFYLYGISNA